MNALTLALCCLLFADVSVQTRLDLATQPEGAKILIDGNDIGLAPVTLFDVKPGRHHFKYRKAGYLDRDLYGEVVAGQPFTQSVELEEEKGILILRSEPAGADISLDGVSLGMTPRLLTDLPTKDVHRLTLTAAGYLPSAIDVKFSGRTPQVIVKKLVKDAGVLEIVTDPRGAEVTVNGVARGRAPLFIDDVPKGRIAVKAVLEGYEEDVREVVVAAAEKQVLSITLKARPGTLFLSSDPDGARMFVNGEFRGIAPCSVTGLKPGTYSVRAEKKGYATDQREIDVANGESPRIDFKMSNVMGRIEIVTSPVGAQVLVDGRNVGATKSADPAARRSDPLPIENVLAGEHVVVIRSPRCTEQTVHVNVEQGKTIQKLVRLKRVFIPDVRVVTANGTIDGVLVRRTPNYVTIEVKMGVEKSIPASEIRTVTVLSGGK